MPADPHAFIAEYKDQEVDGESSSTADCGADGQRWSSRSEMGRNTVSDYS